MNQGPEKRKGIDGTNLFGNQDDPLIEDLSTALISDRPEDHLNFKVISKGLGFHDLKKTTTIFTAEKQAPITFNINEEPENSIIKTVEAVPVTDAPSYLSLMIYHISSLLMDGIIIFSISLVLYCVALFTIAGNLSKQTVDVVRTLFPSMTSTETAFYFLPLLIIVGLTYFLTFHLITNSTIGKMICGLKLSDKEGSRPKLKHLLTLQSHVVSDL